MTNFKPLKDYIAFLFDNANGKLNFKSPFLDAGTGIGDFSLELSKRGFYGDATDISEEPIKIAREILKGTNINIFNENATDIIGKYNLILALDVIEHIKNDKLFIKIMSKKLNKGGYIILTTPNNPSEWGWDDESYGHLRRYDQKDINLILKNNGIEIILIWDLTFPIFWIMRRISLKIFKPKKLNLSVDELTKISSLNPYWNRGYIGKFLNNLPLWKYFFHFQYLFRERGIGHEVFIVGKKI